MSEGADEAPPYEILLSLRMREKWISLRPSELNGTSTRARFGLGESSASTIPGILSKLSHEQETLHRLR